MAFRNQQAFDDPRSRLAAAGVDLRRSTAITDPQGRVLAHARTGGMVSPARREIPAGARLFRFGSRAAGAARVAAGAWWLEQPAFDQIFRFAQVWDLSIGTAMRLLCLVPPEWSDATLLVRARAVEPLLAWRGLAMPVVTPAKAGGPPVRMPDQNDTPRGGSISSSSPASPTNLPGGPRSRWSRTTRSTPPPAGAASCTSDPPRRRPQWTGRDAPSSFRPERPWPMVFSPRGVVVVGLATSARSRTSLAFI